MLRLSCLERSRGVALRRLLLGALALALAGCQTTSAQKEPATTGSIGASAMLDASDLDEAGAMAAVQQWGAAYSRNEKDKLAAMNYSTALRAAGQTSQAVAVMRKAVIYHSDDREVLAAYGKALAADGQFNQALAAIQRAQRDDNPDWQLLAAEGGIMDSGGDHQKARDLYKQALVLAPGEPQILNNLGMSYVLTSELDKAEQTLQLAAANPKATLRVRQNLALVQKLRGHPGPLASSTVLDGTLNAPPPPAAAKEQDTWKALAAQG